MTGIVSQTGSQFLKEDQMTPDQLETIETTKSYDERLLDRSYTQDTFYTKTGLNHSRLNPIIESLGQLAAGAPISVTYYSQTLNYTNKRSNSSDYSFILNNVHKAYSKILNLELRLNEPLTFNYDPDANEAAVEGSGKVYPGFTVNVGDVFLYEVSPGQIGLFLMSNVTPMSVHRGSFQEVTFFLKEWVTNEIIEKFEACTVEVFHYATQKVMGETRALLKRTDYFNLLALVNLRLDLIRLYTELFYDNINNTVFRGDGVYDPYMVEFLNNLMSYEDSKQYPYQQLIGKHIYSTENILTELLEGKQRFNFTSVNKCEVLTHTAGTLSASINGLLRRPYVFLNPEAALNYAGLSDAFWTKVLVNVTDPFELILLNYLNTKSIDVPAILTHSELIGTLTPEQRFYRIPILIYFCNKGIINI